ncbi:MAG: recombinase family protein, partial [Pseudomonadota bacterium]
VDQRLWRNIANANHWYKRIKEGATFDQISVETGTSKRRIQQMIHLAFLTPDIFRQVTQGRQPMGLTSDWLLRHGMPAGWDAQRKRIASL